MSANIAIFKDSSAVTNTGKRELSPLAQSLVSASSVRRIQTNTNGTFKRIINGESMGVLRGEINVIIINTLPNVSRTFYAGKYDPNAQATLPDCWSNLGDKPEAGAKNKQAKNCADCPMNVNGSGDNGSRACRFQRRLAVLVEGDPSGDIYQLNIPAQSLFGKGTGNVHPFESYKNFLPANGFSIDQIITNISYDLNADTMKLLFTPVREVSDAEYALVIEAQQTPEAKSYVQLTVGAVDAAGEAKKAQTQQVVQPVIGTAATATVKQPLAWEEDPEAEVVAEPVAEPVKRQTKKAEPTATPSKITDVINAWATED